MIVVNGDYVQPENNPNRNNNGEKTILGIDINLVAILLILGGLIILSNMSILTGLTELGQQINQNMAEYNEILMKINETLNERLEEPGMMVGEIEIFSQRRSNRSIQTLVKFSHNRSISLDFLIYYLTDSSIYRVCISLG